MQFSGSVGIFAVNTALTAQVEFALLSVKAKPCKSLQCPDVHPPSPAECNILRCVIINLFTKTFCCSVLKKKMFSLCNCYRDSYFTRFQSFYAVHDAFHVVGGPSDWGYERDIGEIECLIRYSLVGVTYHTFYALRVADGRSRVIKQRRLVTSTDAEVSPASMAIVKGYHSCTDGLFTFQYYLPCAEGSIGAVFRYAMDTHKSVLVAEVVGKTYVQKNVCISNSKTLATSLA